MARHSRRVNFSLRSPGGQRAWIALLVLGAGAILLAAGIIRRLEPLFVAGPVLLLTGAGLWFRRPWARWLGVVVFAGYAAWFAWSLGLNGFKFYPLLGVIFTGHFAWRIWKEFAPASATELTPTEPR